MKRIVLAALLGSLSFTAAAQVSAPEKAATCTACHGEGGAKPIAPTYPILAGQYASYLEQALKEYRSGTRKNPVMMPQAAALTDADIKALAQYFEQQPGPLYTPNIHVAPAK
ncbi:cytochrome c [Fontimonas sp. SYSU GA230001]|uniref:c-type cytochrome n=1 Tax=Fontimonas sp. SYSU GA230001 TaxID=3142450 RepID=UPI0032B4211C